MSAAAWQHKLVATTIYLAREAGKTIRRVQQEGYHITNKADHGAEFTSEQKVEFEKIAGADFLTKADTDAQALIVTGFRAALPWLNIVSEEDEQPEPSTPADVSDEAIAPDLTAVKEVMQAGQPWEQWEQDQMCVWIDPVDGTKEFVLQRYHNCTTLLGISFGTVSVAGIVNEMFCPDESGELGNMNWGVVGSGLKLGAPGLNLRDEKDGDLVFSCSGRTKPVGSVLKQYGIKDNKYLGGRGKQLLGVLHGKFNCVLADVRGVNCSKWDICANTALFQAAGLDLVKVVDGKPYEFVPFDGPYGDESTKYYKNGQPFLACSTTSLLQDVVKNAQQFYKDADINLEEWRQF